MGHFDIVMEYLPHAETLLDVVSDPDVTHEFKIKLLFQVVKALEFKHAYGFSHYDLNLSNVLV